MDIIAYGAASKEKRRAEELAILLGPDVKGGKENLQGRLDTLMNSMDDVTRLADRVIVRDAVNLMKAEARLNTVVQAKKYGMDHMVFDDLLDLSGIDTLKSTGYTHDAVKGSIIGGNIITKSIPVGDATKVIFQVEEEAEFYSSDLINSPVVVTPSSNYYSNTSHIFDNNIETGFWFNTAGMNEYVKVDFGLNQEKVIQKLSLAAPNTNYPVKGSLKSFEIQASNDGVSWSLIHKVENQPEWSAYERREFKFENGIKYRYYRIANMANFGYARHILGEIEMMEEVEGDSRYLGEYHAKFEGNKDVVDLVPGVLTNMTSDGGNTPQNIIIEMSLPVGIKILNYGLIWT